MRKKYILIAIAGMFISNASHADPIAYDFNFDTGVGFVTGTFTADFDNGNNFPVSSFLLSFNGVNFDMGTLLGRIASGATDFTGLSSTLFGGVTMTSSSVGGAMLDLNTCGAVACQAIWSGIPGIMNGNFVLTQPGAVSRASTTIPEPSTLALLGIGIAGMGLARRRSKV